MKKLVFLFTMIFIFTCSAATEKNDLSSYNLSGEFIAPKPGIYEIRCSVFSGSGHRKMNGTLVVK